MPDMGTSLYKLVSYRINMIDRICWGRPAFRKKPELHHPPAGWRLPAEKAGTNLAAGDWVLPVSSGGRQRDPVNPVDPV